MRNEEFLLTVEQSRQVIAEVNRWIRRTGTNYNRLVTAARVNPSIRSDVRHRGRRLTIETGRRLERAMKLNPGGIKRDDHKRRVREQAAEMLQRQRERIKADYPAAPPKMESRMCPRCGARAGMCEHRF